jgi:hypothetical protein
VRFLLRLRCLSARLRSPSNLLCAPFVSLRRILLSAAVGSPPPIPAGGDKHRGT